MSEETTVTNNFLIKNGRKHFLIDCQKCNKRMEIRSDYIKKHSGICMSCQKKNNSFAKKHGDYKSRLYKIWLGLGHRRYGGFKPSVCDEWKEYPKFKEWALENGYKKELTIDRIDNKKNYYPENCQWITLAENSGKDKKLFTKEEGAEIYKQRKRIGVTQNKMAEILGVSRNTIQRIERKEKDDRK